ncbi:hypothetical protein KK103_09655 [Curtobacterium flaccumfaciens pv. flaccumfaciens]|uniref:Uncharacterized protein n=1 Tax=Curtobacterium flaccumfaciens pv. flaccumfaciens TaxID=138532 RepID=A0A9Q2W2A0_9MICO|nr:hypothetical protein [Curtobacterium flaccumfaciens]MBT1542027.1 hypothetical protein [Curtobacterium flaccumfaciens pv. flaccumfaciens]
MEPIEVLSAVVGIVGVIGAGLAAVYKGYPGPVEAFAQPGGTFTYGDDSFYTPGLFLKVRNQGPNRVHDVVVRVGESGALLVNRNIGPLEPGAEGVVPTAIAGDFTNLRVELRWKRTLFHRSKVTFVTSL